MGTSTQELRPAGGGPTALDPHPGGESGRKRRRINWGFDRFSGLYVWALLIVIFGLWVPDTFLTVQTLRNIASQEAITAMLALGLLIPLAAGAYDLSIGAMLGLALVLVTYFQSVLSWSPLLAIVATLAAGAIVGVLNGLVVVGLRVNSFIATLGMSSILTALIFWVSGGQQITTNIPQGFKDLGRTEVASIPLPVIYLAVLVLVLWIVMEWRPLGRKLYATGGNPVAARLSGVRTDRLVFLSLICSATIAALAGIVFGARIGSASLTAGPPFLLPAFAAVFLGSTQIRNGRANVLGTLIAVYLLATGVKGLLLVGVPLWVSDLFHGVTLIGAVALAVGRGRSLTSGSH